MSHRDKCLISGIKIHHMCVVFVGARERVAKRIFQSRTCEAESHSRKEKWESYLDLWTVIRQIWEPHMDRVCHLN